MEKSRFVFCVLIVLLMFVLPLVISEGVLDDDAKIDKAYDCLGEKVEGECSSLSLEEMIFSCLAIGECEEEILNASKNNGCWPSSDCDIKTTAQAILALDQKGEDTDEAEAWLFSKNKTPSGMIWYLQIESNQETTCSVTYSGSSHDITIGADKKIISGAGSCLSLSEGGWWLEISPECYSNDFEISCDKDFLTSLLFKKTNLDTINVLGKTNSASAGGTTTEKINSFCFGVDEVCDYEGSAWATMVLDYLDYEVASYVPYLITSASDNQEYLPETFLYYLTGSSSFKTDLLEKQKSDKWWFESDDKFYDTALVLSVLRNDFLRQKTNSEAWLLEVQGSDGCWNNGNIRDTGFILYSSFAGSRSSPEIREDDLDCEDEGYFCMSGIDCEGNILDYDCAGVFRCCDEEKQEKTCEEIGGEICSSSETKCEYGEWDDSVIGLNYGQRCCVSGVCKEAADEETMCAEYGGVCRVSCNEDEEESDYNCDYGDVCCSEKLAPSPSGKNYFWTWVFLILCVLVFLGIIFRNKLRPYWFKVKSKFGKTKPGFPRGGPRFPPASSSVALRRPRPRKIFPPTQRPAVRRPRAKPQGEIGDVLKKLKDMGK